MGSKASILGFAALTSVLFSGCAAFHPPPPTIIVVRESATQSCPESGIGYLRVLRVPPFSQVQVNGRVVGETPMDGFLPMPAGVSRVSVLHAYFPPLDTLVDLKAGEHRVIRFVNPSRESESGLPDSL